MKDTEMTRDYSQFFPGSKATSSKPVSALHLLGWQPFFAQQCSVDELAQTPPVRVTTVHRNGAEAVGETINAFLSPTLEATVGDWVLFDADQPTHSRVLERKSLIKRRAPGHDRKLQLIAANLDTAFITTSCNADFNVARLERYIALAFEAEVTPVILLTKPDLADPAPYIAQASAISDTVPVIALNAKSDEPCEKLAPWCKPGQTVAFLGSSGVGKSTLVNAIAQAGLDTQGIREDDAKGRHTTTRRELFFIPDGCAVLDTPGMRELQMTDAASGLAELFDDLDTLAQSCKFNDCAHDTEPGCAIKAALASGEIDEARFHRWQKLIAEDAFNSASLAERRAKDKAFGKMVKGIMKDSRK